MSDEVTFSPDLYRGTAEYYDRFRLSYPDTLISDLVHRTRPSGQGRLLDLGCGTGQLAFALRSSFAEVWAVDQEPGMVEVVAAKAAASGAEGIAAVVASAEDLDAPPAHFSVVVIGNAFHRLPRDLVAGRVHGWLEPGGFLALCWSLATQLGSLEWQVAFAGLLGRWQTALGGGDRVPANWEQARRQRPDASVLTEAGFELIGRHQSSSSTVGRCRSWPGSRARCRPCRPTPSRLRQPPSTTRFRPSSGPTRATVSSPRRSASPTNWPARPRWSRRVPPSAFVAEKRIEAVGLGAITWPYDDRARRQGLDVGAGARLPGVRV